MPPEQKLSRISRPHLAILIPWLLAGIFAASTGRLVYRIHTWRAHHSNSAKGSGCAVNPLREPGYQLINPLLTCDVANEDKQKFPELAPLTKTLKTFVSGEMSAHRLKRFSIYLRDYKKHTWASLGDNETYAPASMLKVSFLIAYLKRAQTESNLLSHSLIYSTDTLPSDTPAYFKPAKILEAGHSYTIEDLLQRMIKYSDNRAMYLLSANLNQTALAEVYKDLALPFPDVTSLDHLDFMTAKSYAYFFRVLYNATYLNRAMSQKALSILTGTDFTQGIKAGVDPDTDVAHKFGERTVPNTSPPLVELHDCGIIYEPDHPYLLCVMTEGYDFDTLAHTIATISKTVHEDILKTP